MKRIFIATTLFCALSLEAAHIHIKPQATTFEGESKAKAEQALDFASSNTYYGTEILPDNLLALAPQVAPDVVAVVENYITKNSPLAGILSGAFLYNPILFYDKAPYALNYAQQSMDQDAQQAWFGALRAAHNKLGLTTRPGLNYIIPINDDWIIKASGFSNRLNNLNGQVGNKYGSSVNPAQFEEFKQLTGGGKTYQTVSRLAYWLRAHEAKEKLGLNRICLPKQYLVRIPGRPATMDDTNYVIVEEKIRDAQPLIDTPLAGDPEVIQQLMQLIGYTGLWDINSNNMLAHGDKVCIVDTEQPSNHKPLDFFHKDIKVHRENIAHGWGELESHIIKPYGEKHKKDISDLLEVKNALQTSIQHSWA